MWRRRKPKPLKDSTERMIDRYCNKGTHVWITGNRASYSQTWCTICDTEQGDWYAAQYQTRTIDAEWSPDYRKDAS
jgi:hypothetical protein